jgi:hypothetical protein
MIAEVRAHAGPFTWSAKRLVAIVHRRRELTAFPKEGEL